MLAVIKELTDRFIEFILSLSKGETPEAQLTSALKSCIYLTTAVICVTINLVITNIHQRIELQDMEEGIAKVSVLFDDKSGGSINGFLRVNALLSDQNLQLKKENIDLIGHFVQVSSDYKAAKMDVLQLLTENKVLTDNNTTLIQACKVPAVEQK